MKSSSGCHFYVYIMNIYSLSLKMSLFIKTKYLNNYVNKRVILCNRLFVTSDSQPRRKISLVLKISQVDVHIFLC